MLPASDAKCFSLASSRRDEKSAIQMCAAGRDDEHQEREWLDRAGILLSALCAMHCALTPILVAVAPFLFTAEFEFRTKAVLLSLAGIALGWGFISHRSWKPLVWLAVALGAFGVAELVVDEPGSGEHWEIVATVLASAALIMAHVTNTRACRVAAPHGHGRSK